MNECDRRGILRAITRTAGPIILGTAVVCNREGGEPPLTVPDVATVSETSIMATTSNTTVPSNTITIL